MALNDSALNIPGIGYVYTAPVGTPRPEYAELAPAPWTDLGHSSEDGLTINLEVEKTTKRTWRNRTGVRQTIDEVTFTLEWTALQFDYPSLMAYFSGGDTAEAGVFGVDKEIGVYERALFVRLVDGASEVDIYVSRASLGSSGEMEATPEEFAGLPILATVLADDDAAHLVEWLSPHLGTPDHKIVARPRRITPAA